MSEGREGRFVRFPTPPKGARRGVPLTFFVETRVIQRLHVQHAHVLLEQLDDFIQLLVVAVAVHEDFKLRVASFGLSGLYVHEVDMVFLGETPRISRAGTVGAKGQN